MAAAHPQGFYRMYVGHNFQFLWAAAMMEGRSAEALQAARDLVAQVSPEMLAEMPGFDFGLSYPAWTLVRFGRFDEVLREPRPPAGLPFAQAMWHATRGLALASQGRLDEAAAERASFAAASGKVAADATEGLNSARALAGIAAGLLGGEIAARAGRTEEAVALLRQAAAAEDGLRYDEPADWYLPVRHALGAVLLASGRPADAQAVYEEDLKRNPENGWALAGLAESLRRQGRSVAAVERRLGGAWKHADVPAAGSWPGGAPPQKPSPAG